MTRFIARAAGIVTLCLAAASAQAVELTVSAAASLTNAFKDIGVAYEAQHPGVKVLFNFAASGALLQQIAKGAPVDVFASADFAGNSLVVIVPGDATPTPRNVQDLLSAKVTRIAIGVPASVPVGRYTKGVLEKTNLWAPVEAKMIGAASVRQALDYVARGEVDAGFVYATDAAIMPGKVKVAFTVPMPGPILYPIAPIAGSANAGEAAKFTAFVLSAPAQAILGKYGFAKP
jgi:molybdate transport system substrate-binding protein